MPTWTVRVISVGTEFLNIDQDRIASTVSINRVTHTTLLDRPATTPQIQQEEGVQAKNDVSSSSEYNKKVREYVVDSVI